MPKAYLVNHYSDAQLFDLYVEGGKRVLGHVNAPNNYWLCVTLMEKLGYTVERFSAPPGMELYQMPEDCAEMLSRCAAWCADLKAQEVANVEARLKHLKGG